MKKLPQTTRTSGKRRATLCPKSFPFTSTILKITANALSIQTLTSPNMRQVMVPTWCSIILPHPKHPSLHRFAHLLSQPRVHSNAYKILHRKVQTLSYIIPKLHRPTRLLRNTVIPNTTKMNTGSTINPHRSRIRAVRPIPREAP